MSPIHGLHLCLMGLDRTKHPSATPALALPRMGGLAVTGKHRAPKPPGRTAWEWTVLVLSEAVFYTCGVFAGVGIATVTLILIDGGLP